MLVLVALGGGIVTLLVWVGPAGKDFIFGLARMVTVMVIACPHALGLAIPLVLAVSTSLAAKNGLLIKDHDGFEMARNVRAVLFDKTGTLTYGKLRVTDIIVLNDSHTEDGILKYVASVEHHSEHPIGGRSLALQRRLSPLKTSGQSRARAPKARSMAGWLWR